MLGYSLICCCFRFFALRHHTPNKFTQSKYCSHFHTRHHSASPLAAHDLQVRRPNDRDLTSGPSFPNGGQDLAHFGPVPVTMFDHSLGFFVGLGPGTAAAAPASARAAPTFGAAADAAAESAAAAGGGRFGLAADFGAMMVVTDCLGLFFPMMSLKVTCTWPKPQARVSISAGSHWRWPPCFPLESQNRVAHAIRIATVTGVLRTVVVSDRTCLLVVGGLRPLLAARDGGDLAVGDGDPAADRGDDDDAELRGSRLLMCRGSSDLLNFWKVTSIASGFCANDTRL